MTPSKRKIYRLAVHTELISASLILEIRGATALSTLQKLSQTHSFLLVIWETRWLIPPKSLFSVPYSFRSRRNKTKKPEIFIYKKSYFIKKHSRTKETMPKLFSLNYIFDKKTLPKATCMTFESILTKFYNQKHKIFILLFYLHHYIP